MVPAHLVGRDRQLRQLARAFDEATAGVGRLVLISGEPGVGKTSLAAAALAEVERRGGRTASGVCWDGDGAPGLWPWVQVLRAVRALLGPEGWEGAAGPGRPALEQLVDSEPGGAGETREFHIFDAVLQLVGAVAVTTPVVLVLDDLQWADAASVRLLEFVQRHAGHLPVLLIGTYRSDELTAPGHPLRDEIGGLAQKALNVVLGGLDNDGITELRERFGAATTLGEAEQLRRLTGGNPFFVIESVGYTSPGESLGVQRAVDRRIDALGDRERHVLTVASVVGREVPDAVVGAVVGRDAPIGLDAITRAGLMRVDGRVHVFVHDLVRETVRARLDDDERRAVHAGIVRAAADADVSAALLPAQLAWHATQAVPDVPAEKAVALLEAAALDATARLTHEAAGRHLEDAAALAGSPAESARLTLASGHAYLRAGELARSRERFTSLLSTEAEVRARALLGLHALGEESAGGSASDVDIGLDDVDAALGPDTDTALRAEVLAARSRSRTHKLAEDRAEAARLAADALVLAREAGDEATLASCLLAHHDAIWEPGTERARLALAAELAETGRRLHDATTEAQGLMLVMVAELELGDPAAWRTQQRFDDVAEASRSPRLRFWAASRRGMRASLGAEFARAVHEIDDARDLGVRIGEADATGVWCDQRWQVARHTGDEAMIAELSGMLRQKSDPHWVVYEALMGVDAGDVERAERWAPEVEALGQRWPRWAVRLWLTFSTHLAIIRGDEPAIASLIEGLSPDAAHWAVLGGGVIVDGPMSVWLGRLEAARGNPERAVTWFADAEAGALRLGSRLWELEARCDRLVAQHHLGTATTAEVASLVVEAEAAGLVPVVRRLRALGATAAPVANVFRLDRDVWTLAWDGVEVRVPDSKGLRDLHTLLANAGRDVRAVDLASGGVAAVSAAAPMLDDEAKQRYRRRLDEIDDAIDQAMLRDRRERAAELEEERVALLDELRRAAGLGGRARLLNDESEKMRKTVTARIRDTLGKLDDRHPALAIHLRSSVRTGANCSYAPSERVRWQL